MLVWSTLTPQTMIFPLYSTTRHHFFNFFWKNAPRLRQEAHFCMSTHSNWGQKSSSWAFDQGLWGLFWRAITTLARSIARSVRLLTPPWAFEKVSVARMGSTFALYDHTWVPNTPIASSIQCLENHSYLTKLEYCLPFSEKRYFYFVVVAELTHKSLDS